MSLTSVINDTVTSVSLVNAQKPLPPTISGYSIAGKDDTALDPAGGQTVQINGTGFLPGATITFDGSAVSVVTYVNPNQLTFTSPAKSAGTYTIYVVNADGGTAIYIPGIIYSVLPTWTTSAGSLGSYYETTSISNTVVASGDAPITYSLYSGSLPTGATLAANGVITGTSPVDSSSTTYSFTIQATDAQLQDSTRSFSLTINTDVVTWSSPANATTYTSVVDSAISNVALSATDAAGYGIVYTANALPTGLSLSGNTISGTPTVIADSSTLLTATANTTSRTSTRTINWSITVANDPYFEYNTLLIPGASTTFVDDASTNNFDVTVAGDAKPSNSGPYIPGYYSVFMNGGSSGDLLSFPSSSTAYNLNGGTWTIEFWMFPTISTFSDGDCRMLMAGVNSTNTAWQLFIQSSRIIGFGIPLGGVTGIFTSSGAFSFNTWTHVAVVCQAGSARIYVNGVSAAGPTNITLPTSASVGFKIGYDNVGTVSTQYAGYITNVRINTTTALYTSTFTPSTTPLTAVSGTSLLTCQSNRYLDTSTNALAVTVAGSPQINTFDPFVPNSNYSTYGSGYFDGNGDYLSIATNSAFNLTGDFTIECWFYDDGSSLLYPTMIGNVTGWSAGSFSLRYNNTGQTRKVTIHWNGATPADPFIASSSTFTTKTWHHVAFTRSGSTCTLWVDGTSQGTGTYATALNLSYGGMRIGTSAWDGANGYFKGYISDVRVNNGTAVYTSAFTPPTTPLTAIANTSLLTLQNNQSVNNSTFLDNSTNNFLMARAGNATQGTFSPYGGNWSVSCTRSATAASETRIQVGTTTGLGLASNNFCIEMWVYFTSSYTGDGPFCTSIGLSGGFTTNTWWFGPHSVNSGKVTVYAYNYSSSGPLMAESTSPPLNQWVHYALVRNGNSFTIYRNGTSSATATFAGAFAGSSSGLMISKPGDAAGGSASFDGYLSNLRVVNGSSVYTSNFTPPTTPLTAITNTGLLTLQSNRFIDNSTNAASITINQGTPTVQRFSPFNPSSVTPTSYSGYFDGSTSYLSLADNTAFNFGTGDATVEFWFNSPGTSNNYPGIISSINYNVAGSASIRFDNTGYKNKVFMYINTGGDPVIASTSTIAYNTWNHVAIVRQGTSLKLYLNGSLDTTATISASLGWYLSAGGMRIGRGFDVDSTNAYFPGYVSNIRLVKGTAVYTSAFTPSTTPLTAISGTSLLTCQSTTFVDNSTNNFVITANGNSKPTQQNPFGYTSALTNGYTVSTIGGSGYFDGTGDYLTIYSSPVFQITGNVTIEAYVYATAINTYQNILSQYLNSTNAFACGYNSTSGWYFNYRNNAAEVTNYRAGTSPLNAWTHVAFVKSSTTMTVYINGTALASTITVPDLPQFAASLYVGLWAGASDSPWVGYISDLRMVKGAIYTSNFVPPSSPLTAVQNTVLLNNMTSAGIYDAAMINDMETIGDAKLSTAVSKFGGSSMSFDGTGDYVIGSAFSNPARSFGTGNFTIEGWFYINANKAQIVYDLGTTSGSSTGIQVAFNSSGYPYYLIQNTTVITSSIAVSVGTWTHVAWVRNNGTCAIYVNGTSGVSTANSANLTDTGLTIGTPNDYRDSSSTYHYNGYIDDFRITKGYARYTSNFTPPATAFLTY